MQLGAVDLYHEHGLIDYFVALKRGICGPFSQLAKTTLERIVLVASLLKLSSVIGKSAARILPDDE